MKKYFVILALMLITSLTAQAQVFEAISAKEILPQVLTKAQSELGADVYITHVVFAGVTYMNVTLSMDTATGKATGWIYRYYSPNGDSARFFVGVKVPLLGVQVLSFSPDSIRQLIPIDVISTELVEPWVDSPQAFNGSKSGGATTFFQNHADARIFLAVAVNSPAETNLFPQGLYWLFQYVSSTDTLNCLVHGDNGQPLRCVSSNAPRITSFPILTARVGELYTYAVNAKGAASPSVSRKIPRA